MRFSTKHFSALLLIMSLFHSVNANSNFDLPSVEINLDILKDLAKPEISVITETVSQEVNKAKKIEPLKNKPVNKIKAEQPKQKKEPKQQATKPKKEVVKKQEPAKPVHIENETAKKNDEVKINAEKENLYTKDFKEEIDKIINIEQEKNTQAIPGKLVEDDLKDLPAFEEKMLEKDNKLKNLPEAVMEEKADEVQTLDVKPTLPTLKETEENNKPKTEENLVNGKVISNKTRELVENHITLSFNKNDFNLDNSLQSKLNNIISSVKNSKDNKIKIIGFGDNDSMIRPNEARKVALQRVLLVRKYLIENGLNSENISVQAVGKNSQDDSVGKVDIFIENN